MIEQILPNNNERCYSNFSTTFREVNTPQLDDNGFDAYLVHVYYFNLLLFH
jgi:hypothetical protein